MMSLGLGQDCGRCPRYTINYRQLSTAAGAERIALQPGSIRQKIINLESSSNWADAPLNRRSTAPAHAPRRVPHLLFPGIEVDDRLQRRAVRRNHRSKDSAHLPHLVIEGGKRCYLE